MLSVNPIWFREQQAYQARRQKVPAWRRGRYLGLPLVWLATLGVTLMLGFLIGGRQANWRESLQAGFLVLMYIQVAYLSFRSVISGASAMTRERELQTMDTLLSSPLPIPDLVVGKWMVAAIPLVMETLLVVPLAVGLLALQQARSIELRYWQLADFSVLSLSLVILMTGVGVLLSTRAANSGRAATQAVLVGLGLILGTYLVDLLLEIFTHQESLQPILCLLNPYTALWAILSGSDVSMQWNSHIFPTFWGWTTAVYLVLAVLAGVMSWMRLRSPGR